MTTEQNKAIVRRFFKAFEVNDQAALKEVVAQDLVAYTHGQSTPTGRDAMLQAIDYWNAAFETHYTIDEQIAEGDRVATRVTMHAIHNRGVFQGVPPSGKQVETSSVTIERLKDGKIIERRVSADWSGLMQQLGVIPQLQATR
jgi:steroid delta-isomerase-like uncharacterized protein